VAVRPEYYQAATKTSPYYGEKKPLVDRMVHQQQRLQSAALPPDWLKHSWGQWECWWPRGWKPRSQGWKIHISASLACAEMILARTTAVCLEGGVSFKFLPTRARLLDSSSKQADRGSAGKFITIYPDDDDHLGKLLQRLARELEGQEGPYILSDLRYVDNAPIYVRYGAIVGMRVNGEDDHPVESIVEPLTMRIIPDQRAPRVVIPDGVEIPEVLRQSYEASQQNCESRLDEFSSITPLHFSNAGGVYKAELPDGQVRVLREARPFAGLDGRGRCALERQLTEERVLRDLQGVPGVQQLRGSFTAWEHRYLELDYVDGRTLTNWVVHSTDLRELDVVEYSRQAVEVARQIVDIVESIHERGWTFGDLHPGNILVSPDRVVTMLDLEDAAPIDEDRKIGVRIYEYCADKSADAREADWFAVARCIMLLFHADFEMESLTPGYWRRCCEKLREINGEEAYELLSKVQERYPSELRPVTATDFEVGVPSEPLTLNDALAGLMRGIEWSKQFGIDGSYPGDVSNDGAEFRETLGAGRAGIVLAQQRAGYPVSEEDVAALKKAVRRWPAGEKPGLYDGLAGIGLALSEVGEHDEAVAAVETALERSEGLHGVNLAEGRAGVILAALEVAVSARNEDLRGKALEAHRRLHRTVTMPGLAHDAIRHRRGLDYGLTGLALTDIVAASAGNIPEPLGWARERLREEVDACVTSPTGDLLVKDVDKNRILPYFGWGSAGVMVVGTALERLTGQPVLTPTERSGIIKTCSSDFYIYPGLDHGRAGIVASLCAAGQFGETETPRQVRLLLNSLFQHEDHVVVVGEGLIRLSSDLNTGAAGIALALESYSQQHPYLSLPVSARTANTLRQHPLLLTNELGSVSTTFEVEPSRELVA